MGLWRAFKIAKLSEPQPLGSEAGKLYKPNTTGARSTIVSLIYFCGYITEVSWLV
jgi:hypothetical protein